MNVTLSWPQLKKIREMSPHDFELLRELVMERGVKSTTDADKIALRGLVGARLVRMKAGKVWAAFDVNGVRPAPFVGNAAAPKKLSDSSALAKAFMRAYRNQHGTSYGALDGLEWSFVAKMAKEYSLEEFESLARYFCAKTSQAKSTITALYTTRQSVWRRVGESMTSVIKADNGGEDDDWGDRAR